jgi:hypothetical protein
MDSDDLDDLDLMEGIESYFDDEDEEMDSSSSSENENTQKDIIMNTSTNEVKSNNTFLLIDKPDIDVSNEHKDH